MTIRKSLAIAVLGAMGAFSMMQPPIPTQVLAFAQPSLSKRKKMLEQGSPWSYPAKDGHSVAHGKRMTKKRRNQQRHRSASKGR